MLRWHNFIWLLLTFPELLLFHGQISDNDCDRYVKFSIFLFLFLLELFLNFICKLNGVCEGDGDGNLIFFYFYVYDKLFINFVDFYGFWNIYEDDL